MFDKFKNLIGIEEVTEDEITEEEIAAAGAKLEKKAGETKPAYTPPSAGGASSQQSAGAQPRSGLGSRVTVQNSTSPFKLVVIEPKGFEECPRLVDSLKGRKPVIINLERIESDTARKIFDFLSGATYALNGNVQKVANNIFVFAPENVNIAASVEHQSLSGSTGGSVWNR